MKKFVGFVHEKKGQTGLEFLLLVAAAVLVVAVVGFTLKSTLNATGKQVGASSGENLSGSGTTSTTGPTCTGAAQSCLCSGYGPGYTGLAFSQTCLTDGASYTCDYTVAAATNGCSCTDLRLCSQQTVDEPI